MEGLCCIRNLRKDDSDEMDFETVSWDETRPVDLSDGQRAKRACVLRANKLIYQVCERLVRGILRVPALKIT